MSGLSERLEDWADGLFHRGELFNGTDEEAADLLREAASLIDQQEKALEAADELARCVKEEGPRRRDEAADAYRASTHPEQGETRAFERGVREACRLMRHVDTLDKVPGARDGLPHLNPLWDGSAYVEDALVGPFADRIQRPAPEGEGEAS